MHVTVTIHLQSLEVWKNKQLLETFSVSTSKFGIGFEEGSLRTPIGNFRICEKIGDEAPIGTVFRARKQTGEIVGQGGEEDLILTRILRLDGCDVENANTLNRYIYIHGTNHEELIGSPASHGCIRLRNKDIVRLYKMLPLHTPLTITE